MKYHLITYGCQMNTADAQEMAQPLKSRGLTATADPQDADIIMMNTCTVREQAEHKADSNIGRLREWKAANPERILIVAGCAATRWGDSIQKKYPFIDLVSPATRIEQFPEAIAAVLRERWNWGGETADSFGASAHRRVGETAEKNNVFTPLRRSADAPMLPSDNWFGDENTAYVTIMRGCNYTCSYCIVPQVRGREKYRALPEIVDEIRQKAAQGQRHIMLLGQTVNSYHWRDVGNVGAHGCAPLNGNDNVAGAQPCAPTIPMDFSDLLRAVNALDDVDTIRFMSPHPRHMKPSVIAAMAESAKVRRHIHLPLQSGSTRLLASMKRLYSREEYADIVAQLRAAMPGIKITTDVIVGFPGETDADFADTVNLLGQIRFDGLFAFKYSPRPGTASAQMADDVPPTVKDERLQKVLLFSMSTLPLNALRHDKRKTAPTSHRWIVLLLIFGVALFVFVYSGLAWIWFRPVLHKPVINRYATAYRFDPLWVMAIIKVESGFYPQARSNRGALGLMQLLPSTARDIAPELGLKTFKVEDLRNPEMNLQLGIYYLSKLQDMFPGDEVGVLSAYNAGPGITKQWRQGNPVLDIADIQYGETRRFVREVERTYGYLKMIQGWKRLFGIYGR